MSQPAPLVLCTTFHFLANSTFIITCLSTLHEKMSALKWRMCDIPICEEKRVIVWRCGISRMVCNCKMRVQRKVGLHYEGGCSFQFLLTSPHPQRTKYLTSFLLPLASVTFMPVPKLSEIMLNFALFFFCETLRGAKIWNTSALPRGCRKIVMKVRDIYSFAMKNTDMGVMQPQSTYAVAWKYKNWRAGLSVNIGDWILIFHFYRH